MAHSHEHHQHTRGRSRSFRMLGCALALVVFYMLAEVIGGLLTNSLALLADAGHMLSDAASLGLSLFAIWMAQRPVTAQRTYGYHRAEVLAALFNGAALVAIAIWIFIEAYRRFRDVPEVLGPAMMAVAVGGLLVNLAGLWLLHGVRGESLNTRGAWLHVLGDAGGSVAAIVGGVLIWTLGWNWADPLASVLIAVLILWSSWHLLKATVGVLMEHAPPHLDVDAVRGAVEALAGVRAVHDLHVWTITSGMVSLSAHVDTKPDASPAELLRRIQRVCHDRFGVEHVTIQLEPPGFPECAPPV